MLAYRLSCAVFKLRTHHRHVLGAASLQEMDDHCSLGRSIRLAHHVFRASITHSFLYTKCNAHLILTSRTQ